MSIIEFIIGLLILVASLLASTFCYFVKNEKSGVNAAIGGASIGIGYCGADSRLDRIRCSFLKGGQ